MRQNLAQRPAARGRATPFARAALAPPFSPVGSQHLLVVRHATRNGTGEVILIVTQERGIVLIVDKGKLDEHGGHVGVLQDIESGAILESAIRSVKTVHDLALDAVAELTATRAAGINTSLRAIRPTVEGIAVNRHEDVRLALVGRACDRIEAVILQIADDLDARLYKIALHEISDALCHIALPEVAAASTWIGIAVRRMARIQKYFHFNHPFFIADDTLKGTPPSA